MPDEEFEHYVRKYRKTVFGTALCYVREPSDADDIAQEVFMKLYTHSGSFGSEEHLRAWLIRCAINLSKSLLRSYWYRFSAPLTAAEDAVTGGNTDTELPELLNRLGRKNRAALYLHYYVGYSAKEIAALLGISESAVMARLSRGRKQLREMLSDEGDDSSERNESNDGLQKSV